MFEKLKYEYKLAGIVVLFILMLFGAYSFSFKRTIEVKDDLNKKEDLIKNLSQSTKDIQQLEYLLSKNKLDLNMDGTTLQNALLDKVSYFCDQEKALQIVSVLPVHEYLMKDKVVQTCFFSVSGDFFGLLKLHSELEKNLNNAELASVEYEVIRKNRKSSLVATFYVQNLSNL